MEVLEIETLDTTESIGSGIQSLSGFAYQIRVFTYYMSTMTSGCQIEFETLEDVVTKNSNNDTFIDKYSDAFRSLLKNKGGCYAIQVKRTAIDKNSREKILYNWLLLESTGADIASYILFTDGVYGNTDNLFDITCDTLFAIVIKSNNKANALVSKVKAIYGRDFDKFKNVYKKIKEKYLFVSENNLDNKILNGYEVIFRKEGVNETIYALRIHELIKIVTYEISSAIYNKTPYICTYRSMMQKAEDICERVKDNYYEPDYISFSRTKRIDLSDQIIANSREYRQLFACKLTQKRIEEHLIYQQYYEIIRYRYLEDNKLNVVENIEITTFSNFCDTKEYLKQNNKDTPYNRLTKTKEKDNYYAPKNQTRHGSCIHLTMDSIDDNLKISWEDE